MLRTWLRLDAGVTGANGVAYLVAAGPLGELFGLSPALLRGAGAFLVAFAALVWLTATREELSRTVVAAIIAANAVWALDSLAAAVLGWGSPTVVGAAWMVAQALVVGAFAELQLTGLRRSGRPRVASPA